MVEALAVATWMGGKILEPMLTGLTDAAKSRIKKLLSKEPQQQLATLTYYAVCKAQNELDWHPGGDALGKFLPLVRNTEGTIAWDTWEQTVLPVVFPEVILDAQALNSWHLLVADLLYADLKDKFQAKVLIKHVAATEADHARQEEMLSGIAADIKKLRQKDVPEMPSPRKARKGINRFRYDAANVGFFGRDAELALLEEFCHSDNHFAWFAISGEGGSGKTRLAYELGRRIDCEPNWLSRKVDYARQKGLDEAQQALKASEKMLCSYWTMSNGIKKTSASGYMTFGVIAMTMIGKSEYCWWNVMPFRNATGCVGIPM